MSCNIYQHTLTLTIPAMSSTATQPKLAKQFTDQAGEFQLLLDQLYNEIQRHVMSLPISLQTVISPSIAKLYTLIGYYSDAKLRYTGLFAFDVDAPLNQDIKILGPSQLSNSINRFTKLYKIPPDTTNVTTFIDSLKTLEERVQQTLYFQIIYSIYTCCYLLVCNSNPTVTEDRASILATIDRVMNNNNNLITILLESLPKTTKQTIMDRLSVNFIDNNSPHTVSTPQNTSPNNRGLLTKLVTTPLKILGLYPGNTPTGHLLYHTPLDDTTLREIMATTFAIPLHKFLNSFEKAVLQEIRTVSSEKIAATTNTTTTATSIRTTATITTTTRTTRQTTNVIPAATQTSVPALPQTAIPTRTENQPRSPTIRPPYSRHRLSRQEWLDVGRHIVCKVRNIPYNTFPTDTSSYLFQTSMANPVLRNVRSYHEEKQILLNKYNRLSVKYKEIVNKHHTLFKEYDRLLLNRSSLHKRIDDRNAIKHSSNNNNNNNNKNNKKKCREPTTAPSTPPLKKKKFDIPKQTNTSNCDTGTGDSHCRQNLVNDNQQNISPAPSIHSESTESTESTDSTQSSAHLVPHALLSPFNEESTASTITIITFNCTMSNTVVTYFFFTILVFYFTISVTSFTRYSTATSTFTTLYST